MEVLSSSQANRNVVSKDVPLKNCGKKQVDIYPYTIKAIYFKTTPASNMATIFKQISQSLSKIYLNICVPKYTGSQGILC